ncbi:HPr family phosphocarrier protein [Desulforamulus aeronauticus]|uniref:Phosphocarrier protein n=1 Tax=Desulforamulus aeronauticus DSM 10349 TaxID=1121421 RepID=A0A1M6V530_9FIRM|nr:HPr family phosphocarrier protein [Desulforamulus aeronauticus]SHK76560.1 phosphocarrier protein [Desulforamulus aeronauticus DSM 10349]
MLKKSVCTTGKLELRSAARFVKAANQFQAQISLEKGGHRVDGKSMMAIMELANHEDDILTLLAEGADESQALEVLGTLLEKEVISE